MSGTPKTKTKTKKVSTIKPNGKVSAPSTKKEDKAAVFTDAVDAIEQGIMLFDSIHQKLNSKLARATKLVDEIRALCKEKGINMPIELSSAVKDANSLSVYSAKLGRYLETVKDKNADVGKRVALLGVMVELGQKIDDIDLGE